MTEALPSPAAAPSWRCFLALEPDPSVRAALVACQERLRRIAAEVRWVRAESLHLTLEFLGSVRVDRLEALRAAVQAVCADLVPWHLHFRGLGAFPPSGPPQVVWAGVEDDGTLARFVPRLRAALVALGLPVEARRFVPHVTLGRVRTRAVPSTLRPVLEAGSAPDFGSVLAREIVLFRSSLQPGGAVHSPCWTIPLTENRSPR